MNREIKFRGKRLDNGEWCYGYYTYANDTHTIQWVNEDGAPWWADVDPETIGQFTGLYDIEQHEVYEGDIVTYRKYYKPGKTDSKNRTYRCWRAVVVWREDYGGFVLRTNSGYCKSLIKPSIVMDMRILGNIHSISSDDLGENYNANEEIRR